MHQTLIDLVIIFGVSAMIIYLFARLKQPPIAGYLISGVLIGNHGLSLITNVQEIQGLAEIGLVFLLFSVGIEFSFKQLLRIRGAFFVVGGIQVLLTTLLGALITYYYSHDWSKSFVVGFIISLSSTAIVLKLMHERREINTPYGDLTLGTLLFQDVVAVPILILIPFLSASRDAGPTETFNLISLAYIIAKGVALVGAIYLGARYFVPKLLDKIARTGLRELFLITIALITFGCAVAGEKLGLSLAMGAFIAGLMVSESQYGNQVVSDLVPLKEPFIALFFVSVGLLLDLNYLLNNLGLVFAVSLTILFIKFIITATIARLYKLEARAATLFGILVSQIGEFSFVIAGAALNANILTNAEFQLVLSVIVLTMLFSPTLIRSSPLFSNQLANLDPFKKILTTNRSRNVPASETLQDHVVIVGFGMNGQNLAQSLKLLGILFSVVDINTKSIEVAKQKEALAIFGDGSKKEVLEAAGLLNARMAVIAINDLNWIAKVVHAVRNIRPDIYLVVRCIYLRDAQVLSNYKIDEIIIGEELTAKELLSRVLLGFGFGKAETENTIDETSLFDLASVQEGQEE